VRCLSSTQFGRTLPVREPYPAAGRPPPSACADAQALARRTSWWLPGDLAAFASSPPGKKNSRGAARLRQIEPGYNPLPQLRHGVTARRRTFTASPVRRGGPETVLGCVLSPRDFPRCQPRQTPRGGEPPGCECVFRHRICSSGHHRDRRRHIRDRHELITKAMGRTRPS